VRGRRGRRRNYLQHSDTNATAAPELIITTKRHKHTLVPFCGFLQK
jgi:hypothetical protein